MFSELIWVKKNSLSESFCKEMIEERMKGEIEKLLSNQLDKEMELEVL